MARGSHSARLFHGARPMPCKIRSGVSYCVIDRQCYFIDLDRDRYFTLGPELGARLATLTNSEPQPAISELTCDLERLDLTEPADAWETIGPFTHIRPSGVADRTRPPWQLLVGTCLTYFFVARRLRKLKLTGSAALLGKVRASGEVARRRRSLGELASAVTRAKQLIGEHDRCLPWSIATGLLLLRHGFAADVILGVSANPFTAHCWTQYGDVIVGDDLDRVRSFTPIAAL